MIGAQRVDVVTVPTRDRERDGGAFTDPDGNRLPIHHRYAPYAGEKMP